MDNQFNTLIDSYTSNYVQYNITGNAKYQTAYKSAKQGIDSLLNGMNLMVDKTPQPVGLKRDIQKNKEAQMRGNINNIVSLQGMTTTQYITIGVLGGLICLLYII